MTDLVACYWTVAGPVDIHYGREWSTFSWEDRCAQAAAKGFSGLGLWMADIDHQLERRSIPELAAIFRDAGLRHLELEFIADFFREPGTPERTESDRVRRLLFDCAAEFGAHHIKVGNIPGAPCPPDRLAEAFAEICADAAQSTDAKIAYEFMPFDVNVRSLDAALALMAGAGEPANAGLVIDTWHMSKLGITPEELKRVRPEQLAWVELSDGHFESMEDEVAEVTRFRELPGEGEFDIRGYIEALAPAYVGQPWGVEVLSEALRALPIEAGFQRAYDTSVAQFAAAEEGVRQDG